MLGPLGCPDSNPPGPPQLDGDISRDADLSDPLGDADGDGLCNGSEQMRGTDPLAADTDADGLPDAIEVQLGYDPIDPSSPDRAALVILHETADSTAQAMVSDVVRGEGETYTGAFESLFLRDSDTTAATFYTGSVALLANPMENVAFVVPEEERFSGVLGMTQLVFEVRFAFGTAAPRACTRAYPFRYVIKRDDGSFVGTPRFILVVGPPGATLSDGPWCAPSACF